ncbi:hypothetical protein DERP_001645 [Dermatophagoides pteronyssinus]|uniref:Uncharacterized protein n=1 Tax=Dermatophagoides pteronyssinus TaxID=6956 RepID=A0ABQ8JB40_DERPT|nr:hypothetical protein DERP_001645 [Dermatophagoides pteronyssinus]
MLNYIAIKYISSLSLSSSLTNIINLCFQFVTDCNREMIKYNHQSFNDNHVKPTTNEILKSYQQILVN